MSSAKWRPFCFGFNVLTHCLLDPFLYSCPCVVEDVWTTLLYNVAATMQALCNVVAMSLQRGCNVELQRCHNLSGTIQIYVVTTL